MIPQNYPVGTWLACVLIIHDGGGRKTELRTADLQAMGMPTVLEVGVVAIERSTWGGVKTMYWKLDY